MNNLEVRLNEGTVKTIPSYEVAEMMNKQHWEVLRMLEGYEPSKGSKSRRVVGIIPILTNNNVVVSDYFIENTYKDASGKQNKYYECSKLGCDMLANKMSGEKGILFTAKYVKKFNAMEKLINSNDQLKSQLLLSIYNGGQDGILAAKQLTDLEVQEATKPLYREINHKEDVIVGLVEDIDLATKRQRIKQIINHNANGRFSERYGLLYKEFQDKYHIDIKRRMNNLEPKSIITNKEGKDVKITNKIKTNQMEYIDKILCMTPQLYEIACKVFENDVEELMKEWKNII